MLPSDHFVLFYNELFKMLEEKSHQDLQEYWMEISGLQKTINGPFIEKDGLKGMYDYWEHIRIEENCQAEDGDHTRQRGMQSFLQHAGDCNPTRPATRPDPRSKMQDAGCKMQDAGCRIGPREQE